MIIWLVGGVGSLYQYNTNSRTNICRYTWNMCRKRDKFGRYGNDAVSSYCICKESICKKTTLNRSTKRRQELDIVDEDGYRFLFDYDNRGELATP